MTGEGAEPGAAAARAGGGDDAYSRERRLWRRAAVYGSLWAAVEIVVGSFLHNIRFPLTGTILSSVGVVLLTVGHRSAPERGLIWRAALVCSLMKSISPSAVILGPMVGILMEGLLLEAMVRLWRGRALGYLIGGALAVSWTMAQRLLNALIVFGPDLVRLYVDAYNFASRSLGVTSFGPFDLIAVLVAIELALGLLAAGLGLSVGRVGAAAALPKTTSGGQAAAPSMTPQATSAITGSAPPLPAAATAGMRQATSGAAAGAPAVLPPPIVAEGSWSLSRLAMAAAALLAGMIGMGKAPLWAAVLYVAAFAVIVLRTYPRAAGRLRRPRLWIELLAVLLLAGLVFGGVRSGLAGLLVGLASGVTMALRATMVLLGFTAISVELRNPVILAWLERRRLHGLSDALGVAFGILPAFTAALARHRHLWRRPRVMAATLLDLADRVVLTASPGPADGMVGGVTPATVPGPSADWPDRPVPAAGGPRTVRPVALLTGPTGAGKTTIAIAVVERLRERGVRVAGILAPGLLADDRRTGFDLIDLATGERTPLARERQDDAGAHVRWSRFAFSAEGLTAGKRALGENAAEADVVLVDEVGPLELAGGGWAPALDALISHAGALVLVARDSVMEDVVARWGSADTAVFDVASDDPDLIVEWLLDRLPARAAGPTRTGR